MHLIYSKIVRKLLVISLGFLSVSKVGFALSTLPHGFYVGGMAATSSTQVTNQLRFNEQNIENASIYNRDHVGTVTQVQPGLLLGYEHLINQRWLVSGEFQGNFISASLNLGGSDYINHIVTMNNQYALQVRAGACLSERDNILYGLIGVASTKIGSAILFNNTAQIEGALGDLDLIPVNMTKQLSRLKLGIGYEKHVTDAVALRLDYSHTQYGSFEVNLYDAQFADILGASGASRMSVSTDMIGITLMYIT